MCQRWMHSGVIKHHCHSYWWSDMKRSAWGSKGSLDGKSWLYQKTTKSFHLFGHLTRALAVKVDAFFRCMLKLFLYQSSQRIVIFMWMLNCTWGNKGQEKFCFNHQQLWIRHLCIFHLFISYLCLGRRNNSISIFYTNIWTKQLTVVCFNTNTFFDQLVLINWRSKFYRTVWKKKVTYILLQNQKVFCVLITTNIHSSLLRQFCIYYK